MGRRAVVARVGEAPSAAPCLLSLRRVCPPTRAVRKLRGNGYQIPPLPKPTSMVEALVLLAILSMKCGEHCPCLAKSPKSSRLHMARVGALWSSRTTIRDAAALAHLVLRAGRAWHARAGGACGARPAHAAAVAPLPHAPLRAQGRARDFRKPTQCNTLTLACRFAHTSSEKVASPNNRRVATQSLTISVVVVVALFLGQAARGDWVADVASGARHRKV